MGFREADHLGVPDNYLFPYKSLKHEKTTYILFFIRARKKCKSNCS